MANILDLVTVGEKAILVVDAAPNSSATAAVLGTLAIYDNGTTATMYIKTGAANTAWDALGTAAGSGVVNAGVAGRLALYAASANEVDDVYTQNSQSIDVEIAAQATRSAPIVYTIPNPGDAITAANIILSEGTKTINGNTTFGNNVVVSGDLTVNGALTSLATTNTDIKDKLITLNKGGAAASAGGAGLEFEENAVVTAYVKINAAETGFSLKAPGTVSFADLLTSSLTASRQFTLPDTTGTIVARPNGTPGVANQISYYSDANNIVSSPDLYFDPTTKRLGIGNNAPSVPLHVTGAARITALNAAQFVKSDVSGNLTNAAVSLTADVSGTLPVGNGGTNSATALTNNKIMVSSAGAIVEAAALTNGQLLIGSTGAAPVAAAIAQGANQGVVIANSAGGIALSTVQDIRTTASPTFASETLSGAGAFLQITDTTASADMKVTMATVNTTNATVTTIATVATTTDTVTLLKAEITGLRTGGTAGTAGDSATYVRTVRVKNIAGTVTLANLQSDYTSEDQNGFNATITVSGTNALVQVAGTANNNMTWKAVITRIV
jgi:hypothetical protein